MRMLGIKLLEELQKQQLKLDSDSDKKNQRRRSVFKSWFKRNLWGRYMTHTMKMELQPLIVNWLPTKKLDDTYRGSPKDTETSTKGNHGYGSDTRLKWSAVVFRTALAIVVESRELNAQLLSGQPLDMHLVSNLVRQLINVALEEMIAQHEPRSTRGLVANIKFPKGLLATATLEQLKEADVTITFVSVNRTI